MPLEQGKKVLTCPAQFGKDTKMLPSRRAGSGDGLVQLVLLDATTGLICNKGVSP